MANTPNEYEIEALHRKLAPSSDAFDCIFTHCLIVWDIAERLIENKKLDVDVELVKAGCLLHDIGAYPLFRDGWFDESQYIRHGILGYEILKHEGYDERLCRIASHHTGAGLSRADISQQKLPLPNEDFLAETVEEELVMYADKFHSKYPRFNSYKSSMEAISKLGDDKAKRLEHLMSKFGLPQLEEIAAKYAQPLI